MLGYRCAPGESNEDKAPLLKEISNRSNIHGFQRIELLNCDNPTAFSNFAKDCFPSLRPPTTRAESSMFTLASMPSSVRYSRNVKEIDLAVADVYSAFQKLLANESSAAGITSDMVLVFL